MMLRKNIVSPRHRLKIWIGTIGICMVPMFFGEHPIINIKGVTTFKYFDPESMVSCVYNNRFSDSWECKKELDNDLLSYVSTDKKIFKYDVDGQTVLVERLYKGDGYEYTLKHPSASDSLSAVIK